MIIISEKKLDNKQIQAYKAKGYRFAYGYENPRINKGESVGFILDTMYKTTMDLIDNLLYRKHIVSIKYEDKSYILHSLEEWKHSYQSDDDALKIKTYYHPIYCIYLQKRDEYFQKKALQKATERYEFIYSNFDVLPDEHEVDSILNAFAKLYEVDVDYSSNESKLLGYMQIKYYLDNDLPYFNEPSGILPSNESMFKPEMFKTNFEPDYEVISFGDETYFNDFVYENKKNYCI